MHDTLLSKKLALPVFASDPLSSVAYATESALVVLVAASASAAHLVLPISAAIAALLAIVVLSYRQTVRAYETSGGAYVVARDNLGRFPSLLAAAALLVDYILTVAVSVAAGILALTSAVPSLETHKVALSLLCVVLLTLANLRGVRESGLLFALPTYAFVAVMYVLVAVGVGKCATGACPQAHVTDPTTVGVGAVTLLVVLRAFASGASALTGVEAISNGVSAFKPPKSKNAARTLGVMGLIAISLFLGVSYLAVKTGARPSESVSLLSEIARAVFPASSASSILYFVVQGTTLAILVLAANTSYQGFPRLAAVLASDRFFPRQFVNLGDRLVYSNGIIVLAAVAALLIWVFHADVISLIHLYVIGVFTAFTLSQAGMVRYWHRILRSGAKPSRSRERARRGGNRPRDDRRHPDEVHPGRLDGDRRRACADRPLSAGQPPLPRRCEAAARPFRRGEERRQCDEPRRRLRGELSTRPQSVQPGMRGRSPDGDYTAVYVPGNGRPDPRGGWWDLGRVPVETLPESDKPAEPLLDYVWGLPHSESEFVTVVVPELFDEPSLKDAVLRRRSTFAVKLRLRSEPGVVVTDVPVIAGADAPPERLAVRVLLSGVQAASLRAVNYARSLGVEDTRAFFAAFEEGEADRMVNDWSRADLDLPLDIAEAPYRDLGDPLLRYLRALTGDGETAVSVVMPELVFTGWQSLLHNQRALYLKRLLLFEPRVILSSVPFHLR